MLSSRLNNQLKPSLISVIGNLLKGFLILIINYFFIKMKIHRNLRLVFNSLVLMLLNLWISKIYLLENSKNGLIFWFRFSKIHILLTEHDASNWFYSDVFAKRKDLISK